MRIDEGKLRAYLDQALPPEEVAQVKKQLAGSPEARAALARLSQERDDCAPYLAALAPSPKERSAAPQALRRLQAQITGQSSQFQSTDMRERIKTMFNRSFIKRYQPALAILTVVAIIGISFSFAPVRAMARDFLKIFRVQTVRVVQVDREHLDALKDNPNLRGLTNKLEAQIKVIIPNIATTTTTDFIGVRLPNNAIPLFVFRIAISSLLKILISGKARC